VSVIPPPSSLRRNASWAFLGQGFHLGCQWLLVALFARSGGAQAAGLFALGLAVCTPVMVFANLHLRELQASDAVEQFQFRERLAVRLGALALALIAILGWCAWIGWTGEQAFAVIAVALAKVVESLADLGYGALQARERFASIATSQVLRGVAGLTFAVSTFLLTRDVGLAILALAGGWLLTVLLVDLPQIAAVIAPAPLLPRIDRGRLGALLRQAIPLGLAGGIGAVTLMFPSYTIQHQSGTAGLGEYTAVLYLLMVGNLAALALAQAATPRLSRAHAEGDHQGFRRLVMRLGLATLALGATAIVVSWSVGGAVLELVYGPTWHLQAPLLVWLAGATATYWLATVLGCACTAARRLSLQIPIAALACLASGLTSWWFIPTAGLIGAAWSGMVTGMVLVVCYAALAFTARHPPTGIRQ
jgi:O-antigen/teichoic acid export membrane protein